MEIYATHSDALDDLESGLDSVAQVYGKPAQALREFISDLPSLYVDTDFGWVSESEPESQWRGTEIDDEGNEIETYYDEDMSSIYECDSGDIVLSLFGETIAREFR
jgi:hypothetical protein